LIGGGRPRPRPILRCGEQIAAMLMSCRMERGGRRPNPHSVATPNPVTAPTRFPLYGEIGVGDCGHNGVELGAHGGLVGPSTSGRAAGSKKLMTTPTGGRPAWKRAASGMPSERSPTKTWIEMVSEEDESLETACGSAARSSPTRQKVATGVYGCCVVDRKVIRLFRLKINLRIGRARASRVGSTWLYRPCTS
jgi:hypothetical protein